jgi:hypothetical protein
MPVQYANEPIKKFVSGTELIFNLVGLSCHNWQTKLNKNACYRTERAEIEMENHKVKKY